MLKEQPTKAGGAGLMRWPVNHGLPKWKRWFAWYPVEIGNQRVWLEWVERQDWNFEIGGYSNFRLPTTNPMESN